jgi:rhamnulokinase
MLAAGEQAEPLRSLVDPDAPDFLNPADMLDAVNNFCRHTGQQTPSSVSEVVRCCLESLALNYLRTIEDLEFLTGQQFDTIRIVGGGSQNKSLSQYTADACQRLVISGPVEATALGNILLQVIASGHLPDIMTRRKIIAASFEQQHYEPGPAGNWGEAYERFKMIKNQKTNEKRGEVK